MYEVIDKADSILDLKTRDDQLLYIEMGKQIRDGYFPNEGEIYYHRVQYDGDDMEYVDEWDDISKLVRPEEILIKYVERGAYDIPEEDLKNKFPKIWDKIWDRYLVKLKQRVEVKIEHNEDEFTPHEWKYVVGTDWDKVPEIVKTYLIKNSWSSFGYAKFLGFGTKGVGTKGVEVPDEIIQKIAQNSHWSGEYAASLVFGLNVSGVEVPQPIIQGIAQDLEKSYYYANNLYFGKKGKVPDPIIQKIAKDPEMSSRYVREATKRGQTEIPEIIRNSSDQYKPE
jgi:hypothetical protein